MASAEVLQPVVKMKVDELFLNWLSDPATLSVLYDRLDCIKSGHKIDFIHGGSKEKSILTLNENNNVASQKNLAEKKPHPLCSPSPPPSTPLPSGSSSTGPNGRILQRSLRKKVCTSCKDHTKSSADGGNQQDFLEPAQLKRKEPSVPKFYFPEGRPEAKPNIDNLISNIKKTFSQFPQKRATIEDMGQVATACECPLYWKGPLFCAAGGNETGFVTVREFVAMWQKTLQTCQDDASKFVHLLAKPECNYLEQEDFVPFLQDVVRTHASLSFLEEDPDSKSQYITTVIQRIFYTVNRSWSGKITCPELRKSNFLESVALLEQIEDTNQLTEFFPYDHFYVICYKFFELDTDSDSFISQWDLARHNNQAISHRMIERIFSGAVTRDEQVCKEGKMSFADFVWFLISEEDKQTDTSIEYWFRCMDLDGDGVLSMYELEYLYEGQCQMLKNSNFEPRPFEDLICELLDLVKPEIEGKITLRDLKRCKLAHIFFDTFINIYKYLDREQNDPYCAASDKVVPELTDWERYVEMECENVVANQAEDDDDSTDEQQQSSSESVIDELVSAVKTL